MPPGDVIWTPWPATIRGYPDRGTAHSWTSIFEYCRDQLGVHCRVHGRKWKKSSFGAELTLKGTSVKEAFDYVWKESVEAGISLQGVPLPKVQLMVDTPREAEDEAGHEEHEERLQQPAAPEPEDVPISTGAASSSQPPGARVTFYVDLEESDVEDDANNWEELSDQEPCEGSGPAAYHEDLAGAISLAEESEATSQSVAAAALPSGPGAAGCAAAFQEPQRRAIPAWTEPVAPWLTEEDSLTQEAIKAANGLSQRQQDEVAMALRGKGPLGMETATPPEGFHLVLCTTHLKRSHQLIQALPINLVCLQRHLRLVSWVIVSFPDEDGHHDKICEFIKTHCKKAIEMGLLVFRTAIMTHWHASIAKNTAHRAAQQLKWRPNTKLALCNLDGDNLPGQQFVFLVMLEMAKFVETPVVLHCSAGDGKDQGGTCGRIVCWSTDFERVGGYDESLGPVGYQDIDLILRINDLQRKACGHRVKINRISGSDRVGEAIPNAATKRYAKGER